MKGVKQWARYYYNHQRGKSTAEIQFTFGRAASRCGPSFWAGTVVEVFRVPRDSCLVRIDGDLKRQREWFFYNRDAIADAIVFGAQFQYGLPLCAPHRTCALGTIPERRTMNTRISYRYADKRNCKQFTAIVVDGTITWEQVAPYLAAHQSFIPGQIGLEDLQYRFALPGGDHPWHQITSEDIKPTEAQPTIALSGEELASRLAHAVWDASQAVVPAKATTIDSTTPTQTPTETPHSIQHRYAPDKQPSERGAVLTPARQRSVRTK